MNSTVLTVNTITDEADGSGALGQGLSLRDAILTAIANPTNEYIIELDSELTYALTLTGASEDLSATGDLDIVGGANVTIRSTGTGRATIDAGGTTGLGDRVISVGADSSLALEGIEVIGGSAPGNSANDSGDGGGILNAGTLVITDSLISGNFADFDGGGISSSGDLTITDSTISDNISELGGGGIYNIGQLAIERSTISGNLSDLTGGGGINNRDDGNNIGTVTLTNSIVSNNATGNPYSEGGGIDNGGVFTVTDSTISGNTAGTGSGVYNAGGMFVIEGSLISGNSAGTGGGITNSTSSTLTLINSTVDGNTAASTGGGVFSGDFNSVLTIVGSTISNNTAGTTGGGIANGDNSFGTSAFATLSNTTISGNVAANGGGLSNLGTAVIANSTIFDNEATDDGGTGGILNSLSVSLIDSIVAGSQDSPDFSGNAPIFIGGTNIVADATLSVALAGVIPGDPQLSPLQDNGGPTLTHIPLNGSLAIDPPANNRVGGANQFLTESAILIDFNDDGDFDDPNEQGIDLNGDGDSTDTLAIDQRGLDRIADGVVDLGAVEVGSQNGAPIFSIDAAISVVENTAVALNLQATDPEGDTLDFSIVGGADREAFEIDPLTGLLSFRNAPDFESPADVNGDNTFEVQIAVSDNVNAPVVRDFSVAITDWPGLESVLDVDGNDSTDLLTDGFNVLRVLLDLPETSITVGDGAPAGTTQDTIQENIEMARDADLLDFDRNGSTDLLTDGFNFLRVLLDLPTTSITVGGGAPAGITPEVVRANIEALF